MRYLLVAGLIFVTLFNGCISNGKKSKEYLVNAREYFKKKDYKNALTQVENSFLLDSTNYDVLILKAKIKSNLEFNEESIQILIEVLNKNYKTDTVNFLIGSNYFDLGTYYSMQKEVKSKEINSLEEAIKYFDDALKSNPYYYSAYIGKMRSFHNLDKYDEGLIAIINALKFYPDSMELIYFRGIEKYSLGDNNEAMKDLTIAVQSNKLDSSNFSDAYRFIGIIHFEAEDLDLAIQYLTRAISYDPQNVHCYFNRAYIYRQKGLKDSACIDYRKSAELGMVSVYSTIKEYCGQ